MTNDNFSVYLQNRLGQTSETGGQWYSDTSPFSIPWIQLSSQILDQFERAKRSSLLRSLRVL